MIDKTSVTGASLSLVHLYAGDYRRSLHMREAARLAGLDVSTARLHLLRLERLNVLGSRRAGKNVEFRPNLGNVLTRHYIAMSEIHAAVRFMKRVYLAKRILADLDSHVSGALVLFGSYARGEHDEESDVDLLVMGPGIADDGAIRAITETTGVALDVKRFDPDGFTKSLRSGDPLAHEILSGHIVLAGADMFCRAAWRHYIE